MDSFKNYITEAKIPTKFPITIYRIVRVPDIEYINLDSLGIYWADELGFAQAYGFNYLVDPEWLKMGLKGKDYLIAATNITKRMIDFPGTKEARKHKEFGQEQEIRLKRGMKIDITIEYGGKHTRTKGTT